jgi:hypothetical protein
MRRISIRDKKFSECSDEGVLEVSNTEYEVVIVNAAPIARAYYKGEYEPDKLVVPTCWSSNTQTPSADVPEDQRQAGRCMDCHNNIRGSGWGKYTNSGYPLLLSSGKYGAAICQ